MNQNDSSLNIKFNKSQKRSITDNLDEIMRQVKNHKEKKI